MTPITTEEQRAWSQYVHAACGVFLDATKGYLFETRFAALGRETGSVSFSELLFKVRSDTSGLLRRRVIDAITTGETSFFRDSAPFELLRHKLLPELVDRRARSLPRSARIPIRIWSAASSSGQEVYSIAMTLAETLGDLGRYDIHVLGTDVSDEAIRKSSAGRFTTLESERGLSPERRTRFFVAEKDGFKVRDELRALATFRQLNLLQPFSFPHPFDIVFCRNVAIYFTEQDRARLFERISTSVAPGGSLIIGSTETITGICPRFAARRHLRSVYYEVAGAGVPALA
jgi:chemotaxis protein methyltransferase CheR